MKCPECGHENKKRARECAACAHPLKEPRVSFLSGFFSRSPFHHGLGVALVSLTCIIGAIVIGLGIYRLYFWGQARVTDRLFESGYYRETLVEQITMDNMEVGHVITFFGEDGDSIFVKELRRSYLITGGIAKIELADSSWFDVDPQDVEAVNVVLTPVLNTLTNEKKPLPEVSFTIEAPESPIELINPPTERETVLNSIYPLEFRVVKGSTVLIGGNDFSDLPNEEGVLSANVNVYPQGDNLISVLVKTPHHKERRVDLVLYRASQEVALEPTLNLPKSTDDKNMKISGEMAPGATISVDTPYVEDSLRIDMEKGTFSFNADFANLGNNAVTFRAQAAGKEDSVITLNINYVPSKNALGKIAKAEKHSQLLVMGDLWAGMILRWRGEIVDILEDNGQQILIMDVSTEPDKQELIALDNLSENKAPNIGDRFVTDAENIERYFYKDKNIPHLRSFYLDKIAAPTQ